MAVKNEQNDIPPAALCKQVAPNRKEDAVLMALVRRVAGLSLIWSLAAMRPMCEKP